MAFMLDFRLPVKKLEAWIIAPKLDFCPFVKHAVGR